MNWGKFGGFTMVLFNVVGDNPLLKERHAGLSDPSFNRRDTFGPHHIFFGN